MNPIILILLGAVTGGLIATTGLGGGSLLTPALLFLGLPTPVLIGTDLLIASITKIGAGWRHHTEENIDWKIVFQLAIGSIPAGYLASLAHVKIEFLLKLLAVALVLTGLSILERQRRLSKQPVRLEPSIDTPKTLWERIPLPIIGAIVGVLVGLTSVGSGAMLALALTFIRPMLTGSRFAGTDVAHGVIISLVASLGHASRSAIDFTVVSWVLLGALPTAWVMAGVSKKFPERYSKPLLGGVMTFVGTVLFLK
jgi:uncharacterized protein